VNDLWTAIAALSAALQAVVVIAAAGYAWWQVRESRRSSDLASLIHLYAVIDTDAAHEDRRRLFNELPADLAGIVSDDEYALLRRIVRDFNFLGDLVALKLVKFKLIAESHARPISRVWQRIAPWVQQQRQQERRFAAAFEELSGRCAAWDRLHHGDDVATPYRNSGDLPPDAAR
jgi:hypothetical protein